MRKSTNQKNGLQILRVINEIEPAIIPLNIVSAILSAVFPYVNYILMAYIIDSLMERDYNMAFNLTASLLIVGLVLSIIMHHVDKIIGVKSQMLYMNFKTYIMDEVMAVSFNKALEDKLNDKVVDGEFMMDINGSIYDAVVYYKEIITAIVSVISAFIITIPMIFTGGPFAEKGRILYLITYIALLLFITLVNVLERRYTKANDENAATEHGKTERGLSYFVEKIYGNTDALRNIQAYNMQSILQTKCDSFVKKSNSYFANLRKRRRNKKLRTDLYANIFLILGALIVVGKIAEGDITVGLFSAYFGAFTQLSIMIPTIFIKENDIRMVTVSLSDLLTGVNHEDKKSVETAMNLEITHEECDVIRFHNVSFRYDNSNEDVLKNINCEFKSGMKTAIVGQNGAGKTTLIGLLCGLYKPTNGYITFNGKDIGSLDSDSYRKLFSCVFQDYKLFDLSVAENIAGVTDYDEKRVNDALIRTGMAEKVNGMGLGINSDAVQSDGNNVFSGGQAQKLAIARALYRDGEFMVLDEPTAALDPVSEEQVYKDFFNMIDKKAGIFISHRMSSCLLCDNILLLDKGSIVASGKHSDLLNTSELYSKMWLAQAKYYV